MNAKSPQREPLTWIDGRPMTGLHGALVRLNENNLPVEVIPHRPIAPNGPMQREIDRLGRELHRSRPISISPSEELGATRLCPDCGAMIELRELQGPGDRSIRYWSDCPCWREKIERAATLSQASAERQAEMRGAPTSQIGYYGHMTLSAFNPARLTDGEKLVAQLRDWLDRTLAVSVAGPDYRTPATCALYFYSPGKGRGKTHLAAALALLARDAHRLVAIVDEQRFVNRYWAADLDDKPRLLELPTDLAHLTVYDDIGSRQKTPPSLRDAWNDLVSPRWLKRGWSIFTSNYTPDELVQRETIDDRVYSRIIQMTQGRVILFDGSDQRLAVS